ncbi:MAG: TonB-dependent receptor [Chlorobi bacterium]|nr:TonB-dependent receptor [Chlorobiota bacterium]
MKIISKQMSLLVIVRMTLLMLFFTSVNIYAGVNNPSAGNLLQDKKISGTVTSEQGETLPGVNVFVKGTTIGTITDASGHYELTGVPDDAVIVFSFIGYKTVEVPVAGNTEIDIALPEESIGLEEVVSVGYGTQKKGNVTGAISSINDRTLKTIPPVASTTNALGGRLPGLIVKQSQGSPGNDRATISIRGFGEPLIIVDGVVSDFNDIDPNEIESISVLKDASAAIYGARAGNGVVLITTKRGKEGKTTATFNASYTFQTITNYPRPMTAGQYAQYDRESKINQGLDESQQRFSEEDVQKYYEGTDPNYPNTDWYDELISDYAPMQNYNGSVTGGTEKVRYYVYLGYMSQDAFWKNNGGEYDRTNFRTNVDIKITEGLSMHLDLSNINKTREFPAREDFGNDQFLWQDFWQTLAIYPAHFPDPTKYPYAGSDANGSAYMTSNSEISGFANEYTQNIKLAGSLQYDFKFIKGLSAKYFYSYNPEYQKRRKMDKPFKFWEYNYDTDTYTLKGEWMGDGAALQEWRTYNRTTTNQFSLNYEGVFNDHRISALALYEQIDYWNDYITASRQHFLTPNIEYLFAGSPVDQYGYGSAEEMGRKSYIGRVNYSYKGKYLIQATFRADASAKFPEDKRWGYFPSVSAGWRMSEEGFMSGASAVDNLKLRLSYSQTGYDLVGNFAYMSGYEVGRSYLYSTGLMTGLVTTGLANPNLTWEEINLYNFGVDLNMWGSKLYSEFDVFYRKLNGIPATRAQSLPSTFGASLPPENINSQSDRGFEALVGSRFTVGGFNFDVGLNVSWSRAKWEHYEEPDYSDDPEKVRVFQKTGNWVDRVMGYKTDGLYTSQEEIDNMTFDQDGMGNISIKPGDIKYIDINGDGVLDWKDKVEIGNGTLPHWMYGLTLGVRYKSFDLNALFQGAAGNYVNVELPMSQERFELRWTEENNDPHALVPRPGSVAQGGGLSDYTFKQAGYLRLKSLDIGYNLPKKALQTLHLNGLRIYFGGTNILTWDKLKDYGYDPEARSTLDDNSQLGWYYYPQQATYTLGIKLTL